ncbi:MAG: hypothetical protein L0215_02260 [Gemmataceae bacterium]|nr:hypothetical protein [Gemmataceae bacterium]
MIRTHWRLWCCAGAAAGLAWTWTGSAQERPALDAKSPKVSKHAAAATDSVDRFRRLEILIELAWLNDPVTFPYFLEAHVVGPSLVIRGAVPSAAVRAHAIQVAQLLSPLTVRDAMQERPGLAVRPTPRSPEQLKNAVQSQLRAAFPDQHERWTVQCGKDGAVELRGRIESLEQKLALSQTLRRLHGCTRAVNLTGAHDVRDIVSATAAAPAAAAAPKAHAKPDVPPGSVINAAAKEPVKTLEKATPLPKTTPKAESTVDKAPPPKVFQTPAATGKSVEVITLPAAPKISPVKTSPTVNTSPTREQGTPHTSPTRERGSVDADTSKQLPAKKTLPIIIDRHAIAPVQPAPAVPTKGFALVEVETPRTPDKPAAKTESSRGFVVIETTEPITPPPIASKPVESTITRRASEELSTAKPKTPAPKTVTTKVETSRGFIVIEEANEQPMAEPKTATLPAPATAKHSVDHLTKCIHDAFPGRRYVKVTIQSATELRIDVNAEPLENATRLGERMMALPQLSGYRVDLHIFVYGRNQ